MTESLGKDGLLRVSPFFRIRWDGRDHVLDGTPHMELGRRVLCGGQRTDGIFASWAWDGSRLRLENDRYGIYPLYYYDRGHEFGVSNSIPTLIANGAPTDLDLDALALFFRWGGLIGNDTPFAGIRLLPPSGTLEWERGRTRITVSDIRVPPLRVSRDSAIEGFITAVSEAVSDREASGPSSGPTLLPLSGGRDSRHLLLRLTGEGSAAPQCVTVRYGRPNPLDESTVAEMVAVRAGVPHRIVGVPRRMVRAEAAKNEAIGLTSPMHAWYLSVVEVGLEVGVRTVYDGLQVLPFGHAGWGEGPRIALFESGQFEKIGTDWVSATSLRFIRSPFRELLTRDRAIAHLTSELERYAHWPNPLGAFLAMNRSRRAIGNPLFGLWPSDVAIHCPFMDQRVFEHLLGLPAEITMGEEDFHAAALNRAFPAYADIPYADPPLPIRTLGRDLGTGRALVWRLLTSGTGPFLDPGFFVPRAVRAAVDPWYSADWIAKLMIYGRQLGRYWQVRPGERTVPGSGERGMPP